MLSPRRRWLTVAGALAVAALIAALAPGCEQEEDEKAKPAEKIDTEDTDRRSPDKMDPAAARVIDVTEDAFDRVVLHSEVPVLVDFSADWCPPCKALHPTLEELAEDYAGRAKLVRIDVDESGALARRYGVRSIPALFVIKNGKTVDQTVGLQNKHDLQAMLDRHLD